MRPHLLVCVALFACGTDRAPTTARRADPAPAPAPATSATSAGPREPAPFEVALAASELGDMRAARALAARLRPDASDAGAEADRRRAAARLRELAVLHPERRDELLVLVEDAALDWMSRSGGPIDEALALLTAVRSSKVVPVLRSWSAPKSPPAPSGTTLDPAWDAAAIALPHLGASGDPGAYDLLLEQLARPWPPDPRSESGPRALEYVDAMRATLRVREAAAVGLGVLGDKRADRPVRALIADVLYLANAQPPAACRALGVLASDADVARMAKELRTSCIVMALDARAARLPMRDVAASIAVHPEDAFVSGTSKPEDVAALLRATKLDAATTRDLTSKLSVPELRVAATLALLLGGDRDGARLATEAARTMSSQERARLADEYRHALETVSLAEITDGTVLRWIRNAPDDAWARAALSTLGSRVLVPDSPAPASRVVLRGKLLAAQHDARTERERDEAREIALAIGERRLVDSSAGGR